MKHLLNNLSEEEKTRIREQHEGGIKVNTEKFKSLLESKLGDVKPLVNEQSTQNPLKKLSQVAQKGASQSLVGKTVNLYYDRRDKELWSSNQEIVSVDDSTGRPVLKFKGMEKVPFVFMCESKSFKVENIGEVHNGYLADLLYKEYCSKSSGGVTVPKADFVSTGGETPSMA